MTDQVTYEREFASSINARLAKEELADARLRGFSV